MVVLYKFKLTTIFEQWPNEEYVVAETEGKARFLYWQKFRTKLLTMPMAEFMKFVKCENEGFLISSGCTAQNKRLRKCKTLETYILLIWVCE